MDLSLITKVLIRDIIYTVMLMGGFGLLFFLVRLYVRGGDWPKWSYLIWAILAVSVSAFLWKGVIDISLDIKQEAFVTYDGNYIERGGGYRDLKTVVIFDENGKEIKLLRAGQSEEGEYTGTVIYGKRSKIVVSYEGTPKESD